MKTKQWVFGLLVAVASAGIGCNRSINSVERAEPYATPKMVNDKRIETDPTLKEKASIIGVRETMVGDLVKVQVDILNTRTSQREIDYRFEWVDDVGMAVDSPMSVWKPQTMLGGESVSLVSIAPNPRAKDSD